MNEVLERDEELEVMDPETEMEEETEGCSFTDFVKLGTVAVFLGIGVATVSTKVYKKVIKPTYKKVVGAVIRKKALETSNDDIIEFDNDEIIITEEKEEAVEEVKEETKKTKKN